jgi:hypothetical protein
MLARAILAAAVTAMSAAGANAQQFQANLVGFEELGALNNETGAIFTPATGTISLQLNQNPNSVTYSLTYSGLTSPVTQAHIHFGQIHVPGGIFMWLCQTATNPAPAAVAANTPICPTPSGTVTGTLTDASVLAVPGQNIAAANFSIVPAAFVSGTAYVNVHTHNFPAGEIRGQIVPTPPPPPSRPGGGN